jgi:bacteriorhodopsin
MSYSRMEMESATTPPPLPVPSAAVPKIQQSSDTLFNTVQMTFYLTYVLLLTTGTITLIEALRTTQPLVRHVMNLETCISIIAGYFYSQFINRVDKTTGAIDYKAINEMRYNDWFITTPLMILVIMLSLSYQSGKHSVPFGSYLTAVVLNFGMLFSGYLGEKGAISKRTGLLVGFLFFFGLFGLIFLQYVSGSKQSFNYILFGIYFFIWSLYGVAYMVEEQKKNIIYNILDVSAKCFVGLGLWAYFTKIIV